MNSFPKAGVGYLVKDGKIEPWPPVTEDYGTGAALEVMILHESGILRKIGTYDRATARERADALYGYAARRVPGRTIHSKLAPDATAPNNRRQR